MKEISTLPVPSRRTPLDLVLLIAGTAAALFSLISITAVQSFWIIAVVLCAALLAARRRRLEIPGFFWPLLAYTAWSLLASAFSLDQATSFGASRKLLIFLIVPVIPAAFARKSDPEWPQWALLLSGLAASAWAIVYFLTRAIPLERVKGFMGHYMTQAGVLALFLAVGIALAFFGRGKPRLLWAAALVPAGAALVMTYTRNAWLGVAAAACLVLALWKPKALLLAPVLAALLYLAGPGAVKSRVRSIFDSSDPSNVARVQYARAGLKIIGERPFFGTGPNTVQVVFQDPRYGLGDYARRNVHLHNNFLQIAAERGIPALAAWLVFLVWAFAGLLGRFKSDDRAVKARAAAGLAAIAALVTAGFFEYNFGDAEVALLFLLIITLPFAGGAGKRTP